MLIKTIFKENSTGQYRAEIYKGEDTNLYVEYYSPNGEQIKTELFQTNSILYVENMVSNWVNSIKVLNG
jgi:hypothetical protein